MQSTAGIKTEHSVILNKTLCHGCLSSNRKLNVLGEFSEIFRQICFHTAWEMTSEFFICWECRSVLRKIQHFQENVAKAQSVLKCYTDNKNPCRSLSNLTFVKPAIVDYNGSQVDNKEEQKFDVMFEVKKNEIPSEIPPRIKEENDVDFNNDYDDFAFEPLDEVKDENLPDTLKELSGIAVKKVKSDKTYKTSKPAKRNLRYKMTYRNIENGVKKVAVQEKDLEAWIEKEKSSTYFKNLKNKCEECLSTTGKESLRTHYRKYHLNSDTTPFSCRICHQCFPSESVLALHTEQHYFSYSCTLCGYECYSKANMKSHMRLHNRIVQCLECEATFTNTRNFFVHYRASHRLFICDYCNKKCKTKQVLVKHIYKNHITHRCEECALTFANYRTFKEHNKLKHHVERSEASYCVQCNIQFDNVVLFRRHIKTAVVHIREWNGKPNHKKMSVPCPACPNVYARRCNMMNHYRAVHTKQAKYYCNICERGLLNRTRYKDHMMYTHEGREKKRTKICNYCGRGFFNNRILTNHVRTHTGERPFECSHCDARFAQKAALDSHVKFIHMKSKRKPPEEVKKIMCFGNGKEILGQ